MRFGRLRTACARGNAPFSQLLVKLMGISLMGSDMYTIVLPLPQPVCGISSGVRNFIDNEIWVFVMDALHHTFHE